MTKRANKHVGSFGSVSTATMRAEDLIPTFAYELKQLAKRGSGHGKLARDAERALAKQADDVDEWLQELFEALDEYAPPYAYFGSHPGDGADYGFWLGESFEDDFEGLKVADTSEVPKGYRGEVLHVNDHGNMTLYVATARGLREVWGLV